MKLGKLAPRLDARTLRLGDYLVPGALPVAPKAIDWERVVPTDGWPMLANDTVGDCAYAGAAHLTHAWTANSRAAPVVLTQEQVLAEYSAGTGYDPARPETDRGAVLLDVLNRWRAKGFAGQPLEAFVAVNPRNASHVRLAIDLFGGIYTGLALPVSAQRMDVWSVPREGAVLDTRWGDGTPNSWGGHCVAVLAGDTLGDTCITWGAPKRMTSRFFATYCDEAYALLSPDWLDAAQRAPCGFDVNALRLDLGRL